MSQSLLPISLVVLTYNEELNLAACLASAAGWVAESVVVDSGSTDATSTIAQHYGARLVQHPFLSHAQQWEWALGKLELQCDWILGLDADQRVTAELQDELRHVFTHRRAELEAIDGCFVKRRQVFRGQWIQRGGYYPKYLLKLFRRNKVRLDERDLMDHHFYVGGSTLNLKSDIIEANRKEDDIAFWIDKHNRYAPRHAREEFLRRTDQQAWLIRPALFGNPDQRVVWLKQRWYHLPLYIRPAMYFIYRYVLLLGFLDGKQGFVFHFLQSFWYRLLVDIHLDDLLSKSTDPAQLPKIAYD